MVVWVTAPVRWLLAACIVMGVLGFSGGVLTADAQERDAENARAGVRQGAMLPLQTLQRIVLKRFGGRILEVELEWEGKAWMYEFEVLDRSGRRWEVEVDPRTGRILSVEPD